VRADDNVGHFTPPAEQHPELPVELPGEFRKLPGHFLCNNLVRRHPPPVELFQPLDLGRLQAGEISVNFLNGDFSFWEN